MSGSARTTVGVIGGVGPGATAAFYRDVVRAYAARRAGDQPALLIYSVPIEAAMEHAVLSGATAGPEVDRLVQMLADGVGRLARAGAGAIVMPCNTLQAYLPTIVAQAGLRYIHLIAETAAQLQRRGLQRAALICTTPLLGLGLYQAELQAQSVGYVLPSDDEQAQITQAILDSLHDAPDPGSRLRPIVRRLETEADSILLGCSDLTVFRDPAFTHLPVIDAMAVLVEATVQFLTVA